MKKSNNIDQLFESKLNNQTFELKDSYLADFETKLNTYNKIGKGLIWFILGTLTLTTFLFDFTLLPKHEKLHHITEVKEPIKNLNLVPNKQILKKKTKQTATDIKNSSSNEKKQSSLITNKDAYKESNSKEVKIKNNTTLEKAHTQNRVEINKAINNKKSNKKNNYLSSSENQLNDNEKLKSIEKDSSWIVKGTSILPEKSPDVYIDDTIRRKVVVIDTIVKHDTIIVSDTLKRKIRLFKKKR